MTQETLSTEIIAKIMEEERRERERNKVIYDRPSWYEAYGENTYGN